MTVIARRVASLPVRSAYETWKIICDLVAPVGTTARTELDAVANVAEMLISEEHTAVAPIVVSGGGPQVRIYTLHDDDAIAADSELLPVHGQLDNDSWQMSLPARNRDVELARTLLKYNPRVAVRDVDQVAAEPRGVPITGTPVIDLDELSRL